MSAVLLIGGLDSSGGAGLLRDVAAAAAQGVAARVAATAVTAQGAGGVCALAPVPPEVVAAQIRAAGAVGAVKIGMLVDAARVAAVAGALPRAPMVLDPVLDASAGGALLDGGGLAALLTRLAPRAALITPNLPELAAIGAALGASDPVAALLAAGCGAVLVKGGHGAGAEAVDRLYQLRGVTDFAAPRRAGALRGTGCELASGIAAGLARGRGLAEATRAAKAAVSARFAALPAGGAGG
ncbi:hypothetical protein LPB142_15385 [Rhodobacter xanthinilyticus]|uniref:Pyridoxamine kinase/Phosphomethylpyrimidine kinase domain-containing protein n=1 Tax=Rhodobacter xanthinilyticus TaxID=1850250 RepID=A0A1D9MGV8_9RHOB|nr:bifunctional hydroxymethylpyrimidine kinase/phosphomethylpyrimidine kinase [Rhodobacter xanthinilyticus]AOZ71112.1 hypothetical protein LPB142_15385 [Rhodobacter xanthinilyticus]